jgi:hypothetical protein
MSWAAVGAGGVEGWLGVGTGMAIGVGAGVTLGVAVGDGERVGPGVNAAVADVSGEPMGAVVETSTVGDGDADGVLEQPPRSRTHSRTPGRFIDLPRACVIAAQRRSSASSRDAAWRSD